MADDSNEQILAFVSGALPDVDFVLRGVEGREELSSGFTYDLLLHRREGPLSEDQLDALMKGPVAIALGSGDDDVVHGILESVELLDGTAAMGGRYVARVVPTTDALRLAQSCRIYQNLDTAELIAAVLESYGLQKGKDFDLRIHAALPKREYIVQYQESDWDFLQRWMEHEGFFYWYEHGSASETLVIADENEDATAIAAPTALSYRARNNMSTGGAATIWDWQLTQRRIAARVAVLDYNPLTPHVALVGKAEADVTHGFGSVFHYGEHFTTPEDGKRVAKLRAEQLRSERRRYRALTDCARFRVGHSFELENHFDAQNDGKYLITRLEITVGAAISRQRTADEEREVSAYRARFTAVEFDVPFRPPRQTAWPRIDGVIHAHVAGDTSGELSEIDDAGRYKVRLPFDGGGPKGAGSSRWVRMAQPYAGGGYGTHFPLHKGTEVLLAHIDGDPDRPVIVGSVPNAQTLSPATRSNASQSVIQTAAGVRIEMEDNQG